MGSVDESMLFGNKLVPNACTKLSGPQREVLSSGFPTMQDSNQPTQLQRLAGMLKFCE